MRTALLFFAGFIFIFSGFVGGMMSGVGLAQSDKMAPSSERAVLERHATTVGAVGIFFVILGALMLRLA